MDDVERGMSVARWHRILVDVGISIPPDRWRLLGDLIDKFMAALAAERFDAAVGEEIGWALAAGGSSAAAVPAASARALYGIAQRCHPDHPDAAIRTAELLTAFGRGFQRHLERTAFRVGDDGAASADADAALFRLVFDSASVAIAIGDTAGRLIYANRGLAVMAGIPVEALRGMTLHHLAHPQDRGTIDTTVFGRLVAARSGTVRFEGKAVEIDGKSKWAAFSITYVRGGAGREDYLLAVGEDTTERHQLQEELHRQARHDALTGLPNRRLLLERIQEVLDGAICPDEKVGLCFADLDDFKHINDTYGHRFGDNVLRAVADRLRASLSNEHSMIARLGGDEFVVLVSPPANASSVASISDALRSSLASPLGVENHQVLVSASIGVVVMDASDTTAEDLLDAADRRLYQAKNDTPRRRRRHAEPIALDGSPSTGRPTN